MKITFWGTRGSVPTPGKETIKYGGNTSCVEVRSDSGALIILDCGTGLRVLGDHLLSSVSGPIKGNLLITHTHWDHIQGIPFFMPFFVPENEWNIYAPKGLKGSIQETLSGQMQYDYFPVKLEELDANIHFHELIEGEFDIDDVHIKTHYLNHTALTLGYRLESNGVTVVYSTDHEPYSKKLAEGKEEFNRLNQKHIEFLKDADLVIHDTQYKADEYNEKKGWGHGTFEYVTEVCKEACVNTVAITHHDPARGDASIDQLIKSFREKLKHSKHVIEIFGAAEGQTVELHQIKTIITAKMRREMARASNHRESAVFDHLVVMGIETPEIASTLNQALLAIGVKTVHKTTADSLIKTVLEKNPSLVILEKHSKSIDGMALCKKIRAMDLDSISDMPIVLIAENEDEVERKDMLASDWLVKPFSSSYVKSWAQSWLLRTVNRWRKAQIPPDEKKRLEALKQLNLLDTAREERFDRLMRMAVAMFNVPIAYISFVDRNRQWFKSCVGFDQTETSREESFCAHVVAAQEPIIIPDTHLDDRFAENPLVIGEPFIRFYAGQPIILKDGSCVGTFCVVDTRPRQFGEKELEMMKDMRDLVLKEIIHE